LQHLVAHSRRRLTHNQSPLVIAYQGPRLRAPQGLLYLSDCRCPSFPPLPSAAGPKQHLSTLNIIEALSTPYTEQPTSAKQTLESIAEPT